MQSKIKTAHSIAKTIGVDKVFGFEFCIKLADLAVVGFVVAGALVGAFVIGVCVEPSSFTVVVISDSSLTPVRSACDVPVCDRLICVEMLISEGTFCDELVFSI